MNESKDVLLDSEFVADPDEGHEMGARAAPEQVTDEDIKGSRILIVKRERGIHKSRDGARAGLELTCSFQPSENTRFVSARIMVQLPEKLVFIDIAPTEIKEPVKVDITYEGDGKISLGYKKIVSASGGGNAKQTLEYGSFLCFVRGTGAGSRRAIWDFSEDPNLRYGLGLQQVLALTFPAETAVSGSLTVAAKLAKSGLLGAARDLVIGKTRAERVQEITLFTP